MNNSVKVLINWLIADSTRGWLVAFTTDETEKNAARTRFERHFGTLELADSTGLDNESIDADLAREYASTHKEK